METTENQDNVIVEEQENSQEEIMSAKAEDVSAGSYLRNIIEALLFISEKPVTIDQIKNALQSATVADIKKLIREITDDYDTNEKGMVVKEIAGGYQMLSNPVYADYIRRFYKTKHNEKLSKPALETLAIVAYKQPVTRGDVEMIRGVNSDGVVASLLGKELVKVVGRKDIPGRPFLYGTTKQFLEYFGLKSIDNLPKIEEFASLAPEGDAPVDDDPIAKEVPQNSLEALKQKAIRTEGPGAPEGEYIKQDFSSSESDVPDEEELVATSDEEIEESAQEQESDSDELR